MMMKRSWLFQPADSWFFRDSAPFEAGEGGRAALRSGFPPPLSTMQGALRTALALGQGWRPDNGSVFPTELGGPQDLGVLQLGGPYLNLNGERLYPCPQCLLLGQEDGGTERSFTRLVPGDALDTDLGRVRLPVPLRRIKGLKGVDGIYLTGSGLEKVLAGGVPLANEWFPLEGEDPKGGLISYEDRTGLERDSVLRVAKEGLLYSTVHIRPREGLGVEVLETGCPADWADQAPGAVRLGGEGRLAYLNARKDIEGFPAFPQLKRVGNTVNYTVTLLTGVPYDEVQQALHRGIPGMPGEMLSACIGKLKPSGGWDLSTGMSRMVKPLLPPGSTWFYQVRAEDADQLHSWHGECHSAQTGSNAYGYGQIMIGTWEEK